MDIGLNQMLKISTQQMYGNQCQKNIIKKLLVNLMN